MLGLGTPSGLGIEGATPAGLTGLTGLTPALGGTQMMHTMSDLGLTPSGGKRNEDEERRFKMRKILQKIGKARGHVNEESIARLARRVGFANDIDAEKLTPEEKERKVGNRSISTAGNAIVIDTDMKNDIPQSVQVMYITESKALQEHGARTGEVLLQDLKSPDGVQLNAKLDRFAMNLERLARLDRLSAGGVNCFEAIAGLYESLRRLYEQEKAAAKALLKDDDSDADKKADMEVMCKRSGKPLIHADRQIGVEIAYWQNNRYTSGASGKEQDGDKMDVDGKDANEDAIHKDDETFKLRIEVERCPSAVYPPLRISEGWVPDPLESATDDLGTVPWQDPPQTYTTNNGNDNMINTGQQQLPDLRFVARFDPPITVPSLTAMNIQNVIGTPVPYSMMQQYSALLLEPNSLPLGQLEPFKMSAAQSVLSYKDGQEITVQHDYRLENSKPDFGTKIESLPFSHPRQLVELLPTLRQWACVGSLLETTFAGGHENRETPSNGMLGMNGNARLDTLLEQPTSASNDALPVSLSLATAPTASLGIMFPTADDGSVCNVNIEVQPNADITVTDREGIYFNTNLAKTEETRKSEERLAKVLDVCGDLGVWVEWVRTRHS